MTSRRICVGDADIELFESGAGHPTLFLHGIQGFNFAHPYVAEMCQACQLVAPSHPGFGNSSLPEWLDAVDDIANLYLGLMDKLNLRTVDVIGCSIGGWIAADMASKAPERVHRLALVGPVGVKTGPVDALDVPDIFAISREKFDRLMWHDPDRARVDFSALSDADLSIIARNRETLALLAWEPYMHSPKLKHRLYRAVMPTLLLRGASDGLVSSTYLARYAGLFQNAENAVIEGAGHAPEIEQPAAFVRTILPFLQSHEVQ